LLAEERGVCPAAIDGSGLFCFNDQELWIML
jgi:hypothetical protein